jgi:hypothetical protein
MAAHNGSNGHTPNGAFPLKPAEVLKAVASAYGLKAADLTAWGRGTRTVSEARRVAYVLLREESWLSWQAVAEVTGHSPTGSGSVSKSAARANPEAIATLRGQLRPTQGALF